MPKAGPKARPEVEGEKRSLVDDAYAAMKTLIREANFAPGYQASEQEIALQLGMSRTPVHEASIRLQEDGLVKILSRRGILICPLAPDDIREIYDIIIAIEGQAAELVATLPYVLRNKVVAELSSHTNAMADAHAGGDLRAWGTADSRFHQSLLEGAGNSRMTRIMQTINDQSHRVRMLTLKLRSKLEGSIAEHRRIIDCITAKDAAGALQSARLHRILARDELLPLLESFGLKHL